jgi:hypothetical protein
LARMTKTKRAMITSIPRMSIPISPLVVMLRPRAARAPGTLLCPPSSPHAPPTQIPVHAPHTLLNMHFQMTPSIDLERRSLRAPVMILLREIPGRFEHAHARSAIGLRSCGVESMRM